MKGILRVVEGKSLSISIIARGASRTGDTVNGIWCGRAGSIKRGSSNDPRNLVLVSVLFFPSLREELPFSRSTAGQDRVPRTTIRRYSDTDDSLRRVTEQRSDRNAESEERTRGMHFRSTKPGISMYDSSFQTLSRRGQWNTRNFYQPRVINRSIPAMDRTRDDKKVKLPRWYIVHCILGKFSFFMCIRVSFCCIDRTRLYSLTGGLHNLRAIQLLRMKHVFLAEIHRNSGNLSIVGVQDLWLLQLYDFLFEKIKSLNSCGFLATIYFTGLLI